MQQYLAAHGSFNATQLVLVEGGANDILMAAQVAQTTIATAVAGGQYQNALEALQPALSYERLGRFWPAYLRGLAYVGLQQPREAVTQFEAIVAHREDAPASILFPVASLQLGRARRAAGDAHGARAAYDAFLAAWSEAPRDRPLVAAAIRERAALPR